MWKEFVHLNGFWKQKTWLISSKIIGLRLQVCYLCAWYFIKWHTWKVQIQCFLYHIIWSFSYYIWNMKCYLIDSLCFRKWWVIKLYLSLDIGISCIFATVSIKESGATFLLFFSLMLIVSCMMLSHKKMFTVCWTKGG